MISTQGTTWEDIDAELRCTAISTTFRNCTAFGSITFKDAFLRTSSGLAPIQNIIGNRRFGSLLSRHLHDILQPLTSNPNLGFDMDVPTTRARLLVGTLPLDLEP